MTTLNSPDCSLPQFKFGGKYVRPLADGYDPSYAGQQSVVTTVGGGPIRVRAAYSTYAITVDCTYDFDASGYRYFKDFFDTVLFNGMKRFVGMFEVTGYDICQGDLYVARFVPGSLSNSEFRGYRHVVRCQVNLEPLTVDRCYVLSRVLWGEAFGSDGVLAYNLMLTQTDPLARLLP